MTSLDPVTSHRHPDLPHHHQPSRRPRLPAIPDLRFEQSFLRSIAAFVHVSSPANGEEGDLKSIETTHGPVGVVPIPSSARRVVRVDWGNVVWVAVRDQVISPLLQGAVWGVASQYIRPALSLVGAHVRLLYAHPSGRLAGEGTGIGWLRAWGRGLSAR